MLVHRLYARSKTHEGVSCVEGTSFEDARKKGMAPDIHRKAGGQETIYSRATYYFYIHIISRVKHAHTKLAQRQNKLQCGRLDILSRFFEFEIRKTSCVACCLSVWKNRLARLLVSAPFFWGSSALLPSSLASRLSTGTLQRYLCLAQTFAADGCYRRGFSATQAAFLCPSSFLNPV